MRYIDFHKQVRKYMPLINKKISSIHNLELIGYDRKDARQDVMIYLWKYCFKNWNKKRGAKLSTYIQGGIWRAVDHIKKRVQRQLKSNLFNYYFQSYEDTRDYSLNEGEEHEVK